jgi:hypothetical protein
VITDHDLVLHVGMPRASSIVGPALDRLRPQLRAHGIAYVDTAELEGRRRAAEWKRRRVTHRRRTADFGRALAVLARAEQQRAGSLWRRRRVPMVVAGDGLLGPGDIGWHDGEQLRPDAMSVMTQVIETLSARTVQIVVHTHRQDRLLELAYLRRLHAGEHATLEEYFPNLFEPVLDYGDLVARLRTAPRVSDVVVRPVELADAGLHAFVHDLLGVIGLRDAVDLYALGVGLLVHPSVYSARGAALARTLNPMVQGDEFTVLRRFLVERHSAPAEYGPPDILDQGARARVLTAYAEANRSLFSENMPDLPSDSYADETATFGLGNELRQPQPHDRTVSSSLRLAASATTNEASTALLSAGRRLGRQLPPAQRERLEHLRRRLVRSD